MSDLNRAMIIGRLGRDPEVRYAPSGTAIANFSLATSDKWRDKQTGEIRERTEWHRIVAFGRLGEICGEYLTKGKQVFIEGRLRTRSWEKDGITRYTTEIEAANMQMLGGDRQQPESSQRPHQGPAQQNNQMQQPTQQNNQMQQGHRYGDYREDNRDDDIPF